MSPSTTPATQREGQCHQAPCLPRKVARHPGRPSTPKSATRASPVPQVPRLPRETKVDVTKCHTCHAKRRWMSPSATLATQNEGGCHQVPGLPCKEKVTVAKRHACHAKCRGVTGDEPRPSAPPDPAQCRKCHACHAKTKVGVTKGHACHAKRRWISPRATPATQSAAASPATNRAQARNRIQPSAISATPATQNEGRCYQAPRLPREAKVDVAKRHACHAKCRGVTGD